MKVPWKWLNDYVKLPWTPEEAAVKLTMIGLEVEDLTHEQLDVSGVVSALVKDIRPHPDRKGHKVGKLDAGGQVFTVVSGAQGFAKGNVVLLAKPGAKLPQNRVIHEVPVGGIPSQGMVLCSNELLFGGEPREHEDIIVLPEGTPSGLPVKEIYPDLDDYVLNIDLTVNYSHCQCILGVAIEASALSGQELVLPEVLKQYDWAGPRGSKQPEESSCYSVRVKLPDPDLCPTYLGKGVAGVTFRYSPLIVERRLHLAGMRPVNGVVDATNYVMLETGQPLHAFDQDALSGGFISARRSVSGESLTTLDGEERTVEEGTLVIADARGPVAVAGVLGGLETEVTLGTKNVLIEAAWFDPLSVRLTSQRMRLRTEAAVRFEKGVDPTAQGAVAERAAQLLADFAGGRVLPGVVRADAFERSPKTILFRTSEVKRLLGIDLSPKECSDIFRSLRFAVKPSDPNTLEVTIPPRRVDISLEVDLVEEVARHYGFERLEGECLPLAVAGMPSEGRRASDNLKGLLASLGGREVVTSSLVSPDELTVLGWGGEDPRGNPVCLKNPLSSYESCLRTSLLPGLVRVVSYNQNQKARGLFVWETGRVFFPGKEGDLPLEVESLALAAYGTVAPPWWNSDGKSASYYQLKGVVEALFQLLNVKGATFLAKAGAPFHPGRSAKIVHLGSVLGEIGEVHPRHERDLGLTEPLVMAWFCLEGLLGAAEKASFRDVPRFMPAEKDLAIVVREDVLAGDVLDCVRQTGKNLASVTLFDVWRKPPVPEGFKSLAVRLVYQPVDATWTEQEFSEDRERITEALERNFDAKLRT